MSDDVLKCPSCEKVLHTRQAECIYCGTSLGLDIPTVDPDFAELNASGFPVFKYIGIALVVILLLAIFGQGIYDFIVNGSSAIPVNAPPPPK